MCPQKGVDTLIAVGWGYVRCIELGLSASAPTSVTMRCTTPMCVMRSDLTSGGQSMGNSATRPWETATKASSGHGKNQSIVGPEIKPGNFLSSTIE